MKPLAFRHGLHLSHRFFLLFTLASLPFSSPSPPRKFSPSNNYLLDCGASTPTKLSDGRTFRSDSQSSSFLSTREDIKATTTSSSSPLPPLYLTSRIFVEASTYGFFIGSPQGPHWIRLRFYPLPNTSHNLTDATFTVSTDEVVLLRDFSPKRRPLLREYLVFAQGDRLSLTFTPKKNSVAFVNAIEVVSAPKTLIPNTALSLSPKGDFPGLDSHAYETVHRLNIGGPAIKSSDDELWREWKGGGEFRTSSSTARKVTVPEKKVKYPDDGSVSTAVAPRSIYATAAEMADAKVAQPNFNVTWEMKVDSTFTHLVRLHFCDIVSESMNDLYFDVYFNGLVAVANFDLSTLTSGLSVAYFKDFVLNSSSIANSTLRVQIGPAVGADSGKSNAILNGIEVMKMSNEALSLDGFYSVDGSYLGGEAAGNSKKKVLAVAGLSLGVVAMVMVVFVCCRWHRRPADWKHKGSFSSWLLPIHATGQSTFMNSHGTKSSNSSRRRFSLRRSKGSGYSSFFSSGTIGLGRFFTFAELQDATNNFADKALLGVGGFGKVYLAELEDGTKLAVKRGNSSSDQGINEFRTEIQMLSKLRHRHLVSLMGYCDENNEMILAYEYMAKGPLRDHLYGGSGGDPPLTWKRRLEVCIGAARGLHYLHTGAAQGIIHRDVKTTNILLDDNLVAKVADFGLSKAAPTLEQTHVSTAVKGSFGYLDPEYFRCQKLTEKSDVYSFGVVLFEVLCARPAINPALPRDQVNLAEWVMQWHRKGMVDMIIDPHLAGTVSSASLRKYVEAAEKCIADSGADRPSMGDVLWSLEYALQLQETSTCHPDVGDDFDGTHHRLPTIDDDDMGNSEPNTPSVANAAPGDERDRHSLPVHGR